MSDDQPLRLKRDGGSGSGAPAPSGGLRLQQSSGERLPGAALRDYESFFGADLSAVRIHTDSTAQHAARALNAQAFTHRSDVYFAPDRFDAQSRDGRRLLAHELAHTLQNQKSAAPLLRRKAEAAADPHFWSWFDPRHRRIDYRRIFEETLGESAEASLTLGEQIAAETVPTDPQQHDAWRDQFAEEVQTLTRLNALGLMASHKATIQGRRDELLKPVPKAAAGRTRSAATQLRDAARVVTGLNAAKDYLTSSRSGLRGVGASARTGLCLSLSRCEDDWLATMHEAIQRYRSAQIVTYWNERLHRLMSGIPPDIIRAFFSFMSDTLVQWRSRQIEGVTASIAGVYERFPLFKTLSPDSVGEDELATDPALMQEAALAYVELLNDVDQAIVDIGSGSIHPFNLPEAVHVTREGLPQALQTEFDAVLRRHQVVEFWTSMGLNLAQVLIVFIPVVGPALALAIGAATTAADIQSLWNRVELARASTTPEGDLLGAEAPSAFEYVMAGVQVLLTVADMGSMARELRAGHTLAEEGGALARAEEEAAGLRHEAGEGEARVGREGEGERPSRAPEEELGAGRESEAAAAREREGATLEESVSEQAHASNAEVELSDGTHGIAAKSVGDARGFFFCSGHCALLAEKLQALLEVLPHGYPGREAFEDLLKMAERQNALFRSGAISGAEANAAARQMAARINRILPELPGDVGHLLNMAPESVRAQAPALRQQLGRARDIAEARAREVGPTPSGREHMAELAEGGPRPLHESLSSEESLRAAQDTGIPGDVMGDGTVLTRADFPEMLPEGPPGTARPAPPSKTNLREQLSLKRTQRARRVGTSAQQNQTLREDLRQLLEAGASRESVRINQMQAREGMRVGTDRPDLSVELNGRSIHIEYDRAPGTRAMEHARRILTNDPQAIVILKILDF